MGIDAYISYSREERDQAGRVAAALAQHGYTVWWDAKLEPGLSYETEISKALNEARVIIVLWSRRSVESRWVLSEASFADSQNKILPVIVQTGARPPAPFAFIRTIDGSTDLSGAISLILDRMAKITGREAIKPQPDQNTQHIQPENRGFAFLSYSEEDTDFRDRLVEFLKNEGFAYWEFGESDRDYEMLLFLELEKRIAESTLVLSILSESWKNSVWCVKEYFFAKEAGKPVFLLKAKELGPTLAIAGEHFVDFHKDENKGFQRLARELKRRGL